MDGQVRNVIASTYASATKETVGSSDLQLRASKNRLEEPFSLVESPSSSYAYAYVMSGCNPDRPGYRGYLYNILLGAQLLTEEGSTADIVLFIQMSADAAENRLSSTEERWCRMFNIRLIYFPKDAATESFYHAMLQKFAILALTEYRRVLFLDADVLPLANLDYFFAMSDPGYTNKTFSGERLRSNVILAGPREPASGGFFLLAPEDGDYERLQRLLAVQEAKNRTGRYFDKFKGWADGDELAPQPIPKMEWRGMKFSGNEWTFPGAHADQGLLYYWVRYVKHDVSIILDDKVENWGTITGASENAPHLLSVLDNPFRDYQPKWVFYNECTRWKQKHCVNPYKSILHYTGRQKPWLAYRPPPGIETNRTDTKKYFWWWRLQVLNEKLQMGLDFNHWTKIDQPLLGFVPKYQN